MSEAVELDDVIAFLMGEGPLQGHWFGDTVPVLHGAYWWRDALRKAWNRRTKPAEGEPVALRRRGKNLRWEYRDDGSISVAFVDWHPLYTRPVAWPDREAVIACIRDAADRAFEAGRQGDIHFRFGDIIARADALLSASDGGEG